MTSRHQYDPVSIATVVATEMADIVKDETHMKIVKGLGMMSRCLSYFFSAIADMVPVSNSGPEPMLPEMSKGFKEVNAKLQQVRHQVASLGNIIDWKSRKNTFDTYADKVNALSEKLDLLFDGYDTTRFETKRREFIRDYEYDYDSQKLVNFLTDAEFFNSFVISAENDRRTVLDLMKVVLYYLTQASKIEAVYLRLKGESQGQTEAWEITLTRVQSQLNKTDNRVVRAYAAQAKGEIEDFLRDNHALSHADFVYRLVNLLSDKYFWRDWFVASYDVETDVSDDVRHDAVGGWYWSWFGSNGRDLVVSSLTAEDSYYHDVVYSAVSSLRRKCQPGRPAYPACCTENNGAKYLSDNISPLWKGGLNMKLVVPEGRGLYAISSKTTRLIEHRRVERCGEYFNVVTFM